MPQMFERLGLPIKTADEIFGKLIEINDQGERFKFALTYNREGGKRDYAMYLLAVLDYGGN
jgi:hypothetical protein